MGIFKTSLFSCDFISLFLTSSCFSETFERNFSNPGFFCAISVFSFGGCIMGLLLVGLSLVELLLEGSS